MSIKDLTNQISQVIIFPVVLKRIIVDFAREDDLTQLCHLFQHSVHIFKSKNHHWALIENVFEGPHDHIFVNKETSRIRVTFYEKDLKLSVFRHAQFLSIEFLYSIVFTKEDDNKSSTKDVEEECTLIEDLITEFRLYLNNVIAGTVHEDQYFQFIDQF